jgi:hypothetical protein
MTSDRQSVLTLAGQLHADQRGAAVAGGEREHLGPLSRRKEPSPAKCLERLGDDEQQPNRDEQARPPARERPGTGGVVANGQQAQDDY